MRRAEVNANQYRLAEQDNAGVRQERKQMVRTKVQLERHRLKEKQVQEFRRSSNKAKSLADVVTSEQKILEKEKKILEEQIQKYRDRLPVDII